MKKNTNGMNKEEIYCMISEVEDMERWLDHYEEEEPEETVKISQLAKNIKAARKVLAKMGF